ncbi:MAG: hypothetical protein OK474_07025 [Thaumarchaeota archaeon]|nr:hypothetical protein [Nitrososphaerota archaeon]
MLVEPKRVLSRSGMRPVDVYIWFDIEDYVTKESDDLPLIALSILEKYKAKATCKMVAEKVRVLLERKRTDVISAIARHDVGYHLDRHSRHPVVYEYLADLDVLEGAAEFARREQRGLDLVEKVFSRRASCFGHPGPAWASHYYPAMSPMGIPVYLDETPILNLADGPYWYCGVLNLNGANRNFVKFDYTFEDPEGIVSLKKQFKEAHDRLSRGEGGTISFLFHLHTAINKDFWDAVNFAHGANRTKDEYVRPDPQPQEVTRRAWEDFDEIVRYMSSFGDVRFITASDAVGIFKRKEVSFDDKLILSALGSLGNDVRFLRVGGDYASPSELFYTITKCLAVYSKTGRTPSRVRPKEPLGPMRPATSDAPSTVAVEELIAASADILTEMDSTGRMPSSIKLRGGAVLAPADFMISSGRVLTSILRGGVPPARVRVSKARFLQSKYVSEDAFQVACRWVILPEGFKAPKIFEQIVLQTWTLRPATAVG